MLLTIRIEFNHKFADILCKGLPIHKGAIYGGLIFGSGWALTRACPGPLFALVGNGYSSLLIALLSALFGTWVYGYFQTKLPH